MASRVASNIVCTCFSYGQIDAITISVSQSGDVYSFGIHHHGGHGHKEDFISSPKVISGLRNIMAVDCGNLHTICLDYNGCVFSFGSNSEGQLGIKRDNGIEVIHTPQRVENLPAIKQISCGDDFTICISKDGYPYSFGNNQFGQLGIGNNDDIYHDIPTKITSLGTVEFIECGSKHVICKTIQENIYVWGRNDNGQLGKSYNLCQVSPYLCTDWPDNIVDIKCGFEHTLILTLNQDVYSCGYNFSGQLGRELDNYSSSVQKISYLSKIIRIECGINHSMCIDVNNNLFIFGDNGFGQLGLENANGEKNMPECLMSNIIDISKGGNHTFIKTSNNEIYAFGYNQYSQLGVDTKTNFEILPIKVLTDTEDIWCSNIKKPRNKSARSIE